MIVKLARYLNHTKGDKKVLKHNESSFVNFKKKKTKKNNIFNLKMNQHNNMSIDLKKKKIKYQKNQSLE